MTDSTYSTTTEYFVLLTRVNAWEAWYFFEFFTKLTALARQLSISVKGKYLSRDETNVKNNLIYKKCNNYCGVSRVLTFHFAVVSYITLNHGTAVLIRFWILLLFYQWTNCQQVRSVFIHLELGPSGSRLHADFGGRDVFSIFRRCERFRAISWYWQWYRRTNFYF